MNLAARWISIWLFTAGCAAQTRESAHPTPAAPAAPKAVANADTDAEGAVEERAQSPKEQLDRADRVYNEQLSMANRDDRYVDRQVAALTEAITLYEQFIARAGNAEQYREAVRRSKERIKDARDAVDFLLGKDSSKE